LKSCENDITPYRIYYVGVKMTYVNEPAKNQRPLRPKSDIEVRAIRERADREWGGWRFPLRSRSTNFLAWSRTEHCWSPRWNNGASHDDDPVRFITVVIIITRGAEKSSPWSPLNAAINPLSYWPPNQLAPVKAVTDADRRRGAFAWEAKLLFVNYSAGRRYTNGSIIPI